MDNNLYYQEWIGNEKNWFKKFLKKLYYKLMRPIHSKFDKVIDTNQMCLNELKGKINSADIKIVEITSKLDETTSKLDETTSKLDETTSKLDETTSKLDETTSKLDEVIEQQQSEKNKTAAIARTLMKVKWQNIDERTSKIESGSDIVKCIICGHEGRRDSYETKTTECIFNGGKLVRYVCPECGAIFGPTKFSSLTQEEKDEDYYVHYIGFNEGDCTYKEKRAFMMLGPSKNKTYLNYGCGRWSKSIQDLRKDGYEVYGYEPYAAEDVNNPYFITKKEMLDKMKFDGIYSNDVLEHFIDPIHEMKYMKSLLKLPDSKISHSTSCFIDKYEYTRFHTCFFTGTSNEKLAEKSNLEIIDYINDEKKNDFICCVYGLKEKEIDYLKNMYTTGKILKNDEIMLYKGNIVFGPYIELDKGNYELKIEIDRINNLKNSTFKITWEKGKMVLLENKLHKGINVYKFVISEPLTNIEFVIENLEESEFLVKTMNLC